MRSPEANEASDELRRQLSASAARIEELERALLYISESPGPRGHELPFNHWMREKARAALAFTVGDEGMSGQIDITRGKGRGHWMRVPANEFGDNPFWTAIVWCPECGKPLNAIQHQIGADGQITPSLGHPVEYPPCSWHVSPRLIGWDGHQSSPNRVPPPMPRQIETCAKCGKQSRDIGGWGTHGSYTGIICFDCRKELGMT